MHERGASSFAAHESVDTTGRRATFDASGREAVTPPPYNSAADDGPAPTPATNASYGYQQGYQQAPSAPPAAPYQTQQAPAQKSSAVVPLAVICVVLAGIIGALLFSSMFMGEESSEVAGGGNGNTTTQGQTTNNQTTTGQTTPQNTTNIEAPQEEEDQAQREAEEQAAREAEEQAAREAEEQAQREAEEREQREAEEAAKAQEEEQRKANMLASLDGWWNAEFQGTTCAYISGGNFYIYKEDIPQGRLWRTIRTSEFIRYDEGLPSGEFAGKAGYLIPKIAEGDKNFYITDEDFADGRIDQIAHVEADGSGYESNQTFYRCNKPDYVQ